MSNGVKARIIPRIVMSITLLDVRLLLPGTHTRVLYSLSLSLSLVAHSD